MHVYAPATPPLPLPRRFEQREAEAEESVRPRTL